MSHRDPFTIIGNCIKPLYSIYPTRLSMLSLSVASPPETGCSRHLPLRPVRPFGVVMRPKTLDGLRSILGTITSSTQSFTIAFDLRPSKMLQTNIACRGLFLLLVLLQSPVGFVSAQNSTISRTNETSSQNEPFFFVTSDVAREEEQYTCSRTRQCDLGCCGPL